MSNFMTLLCMQTRPKYKLFMLLYNKSGIQHKESKSFCTFCVELYDTLCAVYRVTRCGNVSHSYSFAFQIMHPVVQVAKPINHTGAEFYKGLHGGDFSRECREFATEVAATHIRNSLCAPTMKNHVLLESM